MNEKKNIFKLCLIDSMLCCLGRWVCIFYLVLFISVFFMCFIKLFCFIGNNVFDVSLECDNYYLLIMEVFEGLGVNDNCDDYVVL